ncbi:ATP-dependent DNA helicase [Dethiothermospora halolimnae]|uniref:ATP-dependent DNA helicase n=1 Tax=Dethiothermospora halolimnae TaxID=3114390 RepID=UPI003CCBEB46
MEQNIRIKMSVRNLVEFIMRSGDLDSRFMSASRAVEGTFAHQKVQNSGIEGYTPEVTLRYNEEYKGFLFSIDGRADGIIESDDNITIDEIKSTTRPLEIIDEDYNMLHWAQAKSYGYIYCKDNNLDNIDIQLTYFHLDTENIKYITKTFTIEELENFFYGLLDKYLTWAEFTRDRQLDRNNSIKNLKFPFDKYRQGQRELAVASYRTIIESKNLFAQAPTGIGKTISTAFPSIKAIAENETSKIFYLTAKTITRQVAEDTVEIMVDKGLKVKTITITAKDKICFKEESNCNPEYCEYAKGHFDRINDAILDILTNEHIITRDKVEEYALKHRVCPFEYSLDLAIWADFVICDYNYAFNPTVYLRRFFDDNEGDYVFLIDESHNLVDRSREMFSTELNKEDFLNLKRIMKDKDKEITKVLKRLNKFMLDMKKKCGDEYSYIQKEHPEKICGLLRRLTSEAEDWLIDNEKTEGYQELLDLYFDAMAFLKISEFYDERYVTYVERDRKNVLLKLFCLDPSYLLREAIKRGKSAIFFSATLTPLEYFSNILGGDKKDYKMALASPFDRNNLGLIIADNVSTRYKDREKTYDIIADYLYNMVSSKKGNYIVFFSSYKYMNTVYEIFTDKYNQIDTIIQNKDMTEIEREEFLINFKANSDTTLLGFAVLGGIFSEGIDLKGKRLIGTVIVGVGLPGLCLERNIIRDYFNEKNNMGYEYSYMYPGMNKVLQAAGRVIRSDDDIGTVLLIDDRFSYTSYKRLFPKHWNYYKRARNIKQLSNYLNNFWDKKRK